VPAPPPSRTTTVEGAVTFAASDGNVACALSPAGARCDVANRSWEPPPSPDCAEASGQGLELRDGRAGPTCGGDSPFGATRPLAAGAALRAGGVTCTALQDGVQCVDGATGRGFLVSRAAYRLL
jgi:hypothetical protein